jgi:hypothetical protein
MDNRGDAFISFLSTRIGAQHRMTHTEATPEVQSSLHWVHLVLSRCKYTGQVERGNLPVSNACPTVEEQGGGALPDRHAGLGTVEDDTIHGPTPMDLREGTSHASPLLDSWEAPF